MKIAIVVAHATNLCIGDNNKIPWQQKADLAHFRRVTLGHPVIVGRRTYESIGKPLPGRKTIVVTRQTGWTVNHPDVMVAHTFEEALQLGKGCALGMGVDTVMIIGGAEIYAKAVPYADTMYATHVNCTIAGDAFFTAATTALWRTVSETKHKKDHENTFDYRFCVYRKLQPPNLSAGSTHS